MVAGTGAGPRGQAGARPSRPPTLFGGAERLVTHLSVREYALIALSLVGVWMGTVLLRAYFGSWGLGSKPPAYQGVVGTTRASTIDFVAAESLRRTIAPNAANVEVWAAGVHGSSQAVHQRLREQLDDGELREARDLCGRQVPRGLHTGSYGSGRHWVIGAGLARANLTAGET